MAYCVNPLDHFQIKVTVESFITVITWEYKPTCTRVRLIDRCTMPPRSDVSTRQVSISHFQVACCLFLKTWSSAKPFNHATLFASDKSTIHMKGFALKKKGRLKATGKWPIVATATK